MRRARIREQEKRKRQLTAVGVVLGVVVLLVVLVRGIQPSASGDVILPDSLEAPANADGMAWGPKDSLVLIEEFSDFQ